MKKVFCLLLCFLLTVSLVACGGENTASPTPGSGQKTALKIMGLKGPTGMGLSKLMADADAGKTENQYAFTLSSDPTQVAAAVIKGDADIAAVPTNLAATLYQKTKGKVKVIALNTLGVLYLLEQGDTVHSFADLKGKTVYATGEGSTPEYILNYLLTKNGLDPEKDVKIQWMGDHAELVSSLAANRVVLGVLPEPNVSAALSKNKNLRVALDLNEEWDKVTAAQGNSQKLTQGCLIVRNETLTEHPDAVAAFLREYKASTKFVNADAKTAAGLIASYEIVPAAAVAESAIPNCNICCITGQEMKESLSAFLEVLFRADPSSVGGALPDEGFYYLG